jgi:hypothetical protein
MPILSIQLLGGCQLVYADKPLTTINSSHLRSLDWPVPPSSPPVRMICIKPKPYLPAAGRWPRNCVITTWKQVCCGAS